MTDVDHITISRGRRWCGVSRTVQRYVFVDEHALHLDLCGWRLTFVYTTLK